MNKNLELLSIRRGKNQLIWLKCDGDIQILMPVS
jgi:hypothetical protein